MQFRSIQLAALGAVAALTLAACGGADAPAETTSQAPSETPSAEPITSPSPTAEPEAPAGPANTGDIVEGGSEFALGETAVVSYNHSSNGEIALDLTVTGVRAGSLDDLTNAGFDVSSLAGYDIYYVDATVKKHDLNDPEVAFSAAYSYLQGLSATGNTERRLGIIGQFDACPVNSFPKEFDAGEPLVLCSAVAVPSGVTVVGAVWNPWDTRFEDAPAIWK